MDNDEVRSMIGNEALYKIANLIGYIEGGFRGKQDQLAQGLVERANEVARAFQMKEIEEVPNKVESCL